MPRANSNTPRLRSLQIGEKFNRWTIAGPMELALIGGTRRPCYACRCACGNEKRVDSASLLNGTTKSCGCLRSDGARERSTTHGGSKSRLYRVWCGIIDRCEYESAKSYKNYGGRGIAMCREWRESFGAFRDWALASGYQGGLTIERIDNDAGYSPENCRWTTRLEQSLNTRRTHLLTAFGETKPIGAWAKDPRCRAAYYAVASRIRAGWDHEEAIASPPNRHRQHKS